jgi:hypothetical protein
LNIRKRHQYEQRQQQPRLIISEKYRLSPTPINHLSNKKNSKQQEKNNV